MRNGRSFAAAAALCALAVAGCGGGNAPSEPATAATTEVVYEVEGDATITSITMQTPTGTSQQADLAVPLVNKYGNPGIRMQMKRGAFVYIAAQNTDPASSGIITCRIKSNDRVVSEVSSTGSAAIATCKGRA